MLRSKDIVVIPSITASNITQEINSLDKNVLYDYPNPRTSTKIQIISVKLPEGPIKIKRYDPEKGQCLDDATVNTISVEMVWRLAGAIKPSHPVNIDRVFGASYNTRSALEALLLHTPQYYICYPGRLEKIGNKTKIKNGHKHIIYKPDAPHAKGIWEKLDVENMVISEVDRELHFDSLSHDLVKEKDLGIDIARRHAQIQMLLIESGAYMGLYSSIDKNDQSIVYKGKRFIEHEYVKNDLTKVLALHSYPDASEAGKHIDCIWFTEDEKKIPAIFEIEHSTGVLSGLNRMMRFKQEAPDFAHMTYIIVADDDDRAEVIRKANHPQFADLKVKFLPYSAVEDLYLLSLRGIKGINNIEFIHTFLEEIVQN